MCNTTVEWLDDAKKEVEHWLVEMKEMVRAVEQAGGRES